MYSYLNLGLKLKSYLLHKYDNATKADGFRKIKEALRI